MYFQKVISKKLFKELAFVGILGSSMTKIASDPHQDPDPDPPQNVMDPQH
jgi:hypothetical protein